MLLLCTAATFTLSLSLSLIFYASRPLADTMMQNLEVTMNVAVKASFLTGKLKNEQRVVCSSGSP